MRRLAYIAVGVLATLLAIAGAILPGLPATPFLLVALWAFSRSSDRLLAWLDRVPLLRAALAEARRFEERGRIRREVKFTAVAVAWGSVVFTAVASDFSRPVLLGVVTAAALAGSIAMWWIPTDR
ncbi:YbaN family protein [Hyphomicrobium sp. LHD-15]|uniref:YbaN family protein n=1 Tax=Hyphomicrobium sp. LHD-15 TaxID=3072142 RepID=UPI00280F2B1E|nr:YbaN family protein [Hyphomicrobium sp. LHD-15]MDQ8699131.1 YbaN family protein [Hyphomicrobium sp. LHD-15]